MGHSSTEEAGDWEVHGPASCHSCLIELTSGILLNASHSWRKPADACVGQCDPLHRNSVLLYTEKSG